MRSPLRGGGGRGPSNRSGETRPPPRRPVRGAPLFGWLLPGWAGEVLDAKSLGPARPRGWGSKGRKPRTPASRPRSKRFSPEASFPDLSLERQLKAQLAIGVEGPGLVDTVHVQGRVACPRLPKAQQ